MVSVTPASRYITPASRYHPHYQSRSSMYIRGLIPRNFAELAESVPIVNDRVILHFCELFMLEFSENKTLTKTSEFTVLRRFCYC